MRKFPSQRRGGKGLLCGLLLSAMLISGCMTEPGETTDIGALTGGAIGAGLGAIVGSQTGDPGAGLVIGAVAGASSGAMIGNAIQAQEESIQSQEEAIERQERVIAAQRSELEELRRMNQDAPSFQRKLSANLNAGSARGSISQRPGSRASLSERNITPEVSAEQNLLRESLSQQNRRALPVPSRETVNEVLPQSETTGRGYSASLYDAPIAENANAPSAPAVEAPVENVVPASAAALTGTGENESSQSDCVQSEEEMKKVKLADEVSDKLFHTRRAIRLCPQNPVYHQTLGEIYLTLNRKEDAEFEFQEALRYDPNFHPAKEGISKLSSRYSDSNRY